MVVVVELATHLSRSEINSMAPYPVVGRGFKAELAIRGGHADSGVESLQGCLEQLNSMPYELLTTLLKIALAQGLAATKWLDESLTLINRTIGLAGTNGDVCYMPELLRVKGTALLSMAQPMSDDVERYFMQSLDYSRRQAARG